MRLNKKGIGPITIGMLIMILAIIIIFLPIVKEESNARVVKTDFNIIVDDNISIFPEITRQIGTFTELLDMKGYKKLTVTLSASSPESFPSWVSTTYTGKTESFFDNVTDGLLSSITGLLIEGEGTTANVIYDFGSIATRHPIIKLRWGASGTSGSGTITLETSDTDGSYNVKDTISLSQGQQQDPDTLDGTSHSFRFLKFKVVDAFNNGSGMLTALYEIYDKTIMGGTGALSFEVRNPVSNTWIELIASSEFGTITDGDTDKISQVGDVNNVSISGKTYVLLQTQTNFRAKYTITNGALRNGVGLELVD